MMNILAIEDKTIIFYALRHDIYGESLIIPWLLTLIFTGFKIFLSEYKLFSSCLISIFLKLFDLASLLAFLFIFKVLCFILTTFLSVFKLINLRFFSATNDFNNYLLKTGLYDFN